MPTDRKSRGELLDALVSYMRGEIKSDEFDEKRAALLTEDKSAHAIADTLWHAYDDLVNHPISVTEECWHMLQRYAAFLRTDLELEEVIKRRQHPNRGFAVLGLVALAAVFLLALWTAAWAVLAGTWLVIGLVWVFVLPEPDTDPEVERLWQFAPFWNEQEWRQHEQLLDDLDLPEYDPAVHHKPIRRNVGDWVLMLPFRILRVAFVPLGLILALRADKTWVLMIRPNSQPEAPSSASERETTCASENR